MKRLLFVLTFFCSICNYTYAQEYTTFMGISLKLDPSAFEKKLIEKGFKKSSKKIYIGTIDGAHDHCNVNLNVENGKIKSVSVSRFSQENDTLSAVDIFLKRHEILTKRYGKYCRVQEYGVKPYDFKLQRFIFYFYDERIYLMALTMDNERYVSGLKKGDKVYMITETYLPLPLTMRQNTNSQPPK